MIADTKLGTLSNHGFEAFFHGDNNIPYVQNVFKNIAAGAPVPLNTAKGRAVNPLLNLGLPTIVCIEDGDDDTLGLQMGCKMHPNVPAGRQDQYVILCPLFWEQEQEAQSFHCPRLRRNTLTPNDDELARNQQAALVHELVHMYGVEPAMRWQDSQFETYLVRDATNLNEQDALKNAANYAYYYSGKLTRSTL